MPGEIKVQVTVLQKKFRVWCRYTKGASDSVAKPVDVLCSIASYAEAMARNQVAKDNGICACDVRVDRVEVLP